MPMLINFVTNCSTKFYFTEHYSKTKNKSANC